MIVKELAVVTGTYVHNGETRKRWKTIGHVHTHEGREYVTLDSLVNLAAIPRKDGDDRVFVSMFDPKPKDGKEPGKRKEAHKAQEIDDSSDVPF